MFSAERVSSSGARGGLGGPNGPRAPVVTLWHRGATRCDSLALQFVA